MNTRLNVESTNLKCQYIGCSAMAVKRFKWDKKRVWHSCEKHADKAIADLGSEYVADLRRKEKEAQDNAKKLQQELEEALRDLDINVSEVNLKEEFGQLKFPSF